MHMHNGFAIALAWPETLCKQAGTWYDPMLYYLGINRKGYYKVGHAAVVLVDDETGTCSYYDFGRYHAPPGHGRVRSQKTDHDLVVGTIANISSDRAEILNLKEILSELYSNPSTHGTGTIFGAATRIKLHDTLSYIQYLQEKEFISYGPFIPNGTNCSRFINSALKAGKPVLSARIKLQFPPMLSPTPMWNLIAIGNQVISFGQSYSKKVSHENGIVQLVLNNSE